MVAPPEHPPVADGSPRTLHLVDGTSQLYRAYYAIHGLTNRDGLPTNAVYGFTTMLRKLLAEERPSHIAVAFDAPGPVFRHARFKAYKAHRPPSPDDFKVQVPYAKQVCAALGLPVVERKGYEADDLIATYTTLARQAGFRVTVVASDKDLMQLVGDGVVLLNPVKNLRLDSAGVIESFGVAPDRVRDVLGLMGDSVDNIPGVPGVGEKTALAVVSTYGDFESVLRRARAAAAFFEARDALLQAIDAAAADHASDARASIGTAVAELGAAAAALRKVERDDAMLERLSALERVLGNAALDAQHAPRAKGAARPIQALRRELKALERGTSRRIWLAIHGHAEQARMSRELATLERQAPVELPPEALARAVPDPRAARTLFDELDFRALLDEFSAIEPGAAEVRSASGAAYETIVSRDGLAALVARCRAAGRTAIAVAGEDAGPGQTRWVGIALACEPGQAGYVAIGHQYLGAPDQISPAIAGEALAPLLAQADPGKVGHDLKRQFHVLHRHGVGLRGWGLDTSVAAFLLDPGRSSYTMARLAREQLGQSIAPLDELTGSGTKALGLSQVQVEQAASHFGRTADLALRLATVLEGRLTGEGLESVYRTIDGPLLPVLARMEARGIRVETQLLRRMSGEMEQALGVARGEIHALAGVEFNVDSPKQLREVLFERLGLSTRRKTPKGRMASTDARTLEELAGQHEIVERIRLYRELAKLKGTYVDSLPRLVHPETGRIHTCYHPTGAATGRLSSSDPNLQNIPARTETGKRIRAAFVPEDGYVFLASDYSQVELRVLAHLSGDPELIAAFRAGEDIHRHTAARIFGALPELVTETMRRRAKAINFGILYGMSETRLAREQGISRGEARRFIQAYFDRFAKVREYIDQVRDRVRSDGAVRTLFSRVRKFPELGRRLHRGQEEQALRAAVNTTIQGTAADLMKMAMLRVEAELDRACPEARMLLQVHDELLLEVPARQAEAVGSLVRQAMESVYALAVPLSVDQKVGGSWLDVT